MPKKGPKLLHKAQKSSKRLRLVGRAAVLMLAKFAYPSCVRADASCYANFVELPRCTRLAYANFSVEISGNFHGISGNFRKFPYCHLRKFPEMPSVTPLAAIDNVFLDGTRCMRSNGMQIFI